jgi:hypothetical protein
VNVCLNLILATRTFAAPPFLTDDPVPVDYQHWEVYLFANGDHESGNYTINSPALACVAFDFSYPAW